MGSKFRRQAGNVSLDDFLSWRIALRNGLFCSHPDKPRYTLIYDYGVFLRNSGNGRSCEHRDFDAVDGVPLACVAPGRHR